MTDNGDERPAEIIWPESADTFGGNALHAEDIVPAQPLARTEWLAQARAETSHLLTPDKRGTNVPPSPLSLIGLALGLGIALLMVLICSLTFVASTFSARLSNTANTSNPIGHPTATLAPTFSNGLGFATQNPDPTPLPYNQDTPTLEPTITPLPTTIGTGTPGTNAPTPTPAPGDTATPVSTGGPVLSVSPTVLALRCSAKKVAAFTLTISNTGVNDLTWQIIAHNAHYSFSSHGGTLASGEVTNVGVGNIQASDSFIVQAQGAQGSPQPVFVNCLP